MRLSMHATNAVGREPLRFDFMLVLTVILVTVFEGAVRKWLAPGLTSPLLLCRDAAAFALVMRAALRGRFAAMPFATQCLLAWTFVVAGWGLFQIVVLQGPIVLFLLGLRFWLLYFWMALAMACTLTTLEIVRVMRLMIALGIVMTPLVMLQHFLPPSSPLNVQPDTDEDAIFRVTADIVRVSGTFTFTMGFACFIAVVSPLAISSVWSGVRLYRHAWLAVVAFICVAISTLVSGSRASIMFFGALLAVQTLAGFGAAKTGKALMQSIARTVLAVLALALTLGLFSDALVATQERFQTAAADEDVMGRIETELLGEPAARKEMTFVGHGLGAGTNAGSVLLTGENAFELAESEPARVLLEMGVVGFAWLLVKCLIFAVGISRSLVRLVRCSETLPLLIWATTAYGMSSWPVSGQVSANAFGYIALGLALCSTRELPATAPLGDAMLDWGVRS
ncbi:hypothetical protein [Paraburkholderia bannensis]|uniref:hypothetical protein n=1 Tax=Paraburkholderia bannensis TaxID=765414 RepID=UPI002AB6FE07|nr:hypothetical protein [Paraburkholderia bannensis]